MGLSCVHDGVSCQCPQSPVSALDTAHHRVVCRDGRDARSVVPGHCGRLQLHKGLGRPGPRPLLGCYNPLPSGPDITSRTSLKQFQHGSVLDARIYLGSGLVRVVMNAVTQHVSKCWAPRCYENRMYSANFERILQVELF